MLVLVTLVGVGCGQGSKPNPTANATVLNEIEVPADVATLFEQGEVAGAIERLTDKIASSPREADLFSLRASARHRIGQNAEALADLDQAISLNDKDARLYNNRGFIQMGLQQFQEALDDFDKATQLSPSYVNAYNNRGLMYLAQKRYDDAIAQFNQALKLDNRYVDAYNNRGFAEFEAGQIEAALDDFNLAIQLNPDYVNAYNNRGLLRAHAGDNENAIIDFTHAMMLDPLNPKYYEQRADVYERQGAVDKVLADEKKISWLAEYHQLTAKVAASNRPVKELTSRASHYMAVNDQEKALDDLNRALTFDPRSAEALAARSAIYLQQKSLANAKADAELSLLIQPNEAAYSVLGDLFLRQRDFDRAIENFAQARRVDPSVAEAYYGRSKLLEKQGKPEQAKDSLEQALALDPDIESRLR
jgi:tetratricopeptide (TPR) repeat protein